jgi:hypothetical protein
MGDAGCDIFVDLTVGVPQFKGTSAIRGADQHRLVDRREGRGRGFGKVRRAAILCRKISSVPNEFPHVSVVRDDTQHDILARRADQDRRMGRWSGLATVLKVEEGALPTGSTGSGIE